MGRGSIFTIRLPLHLSGKEKLSVPEKQDSIVPARILVIDDDEMMRSVLTDILIQSSCQVVQASSGHEGMALFASDEFDIVLTDLGLNDMSGWDVARLIKKQSKSTPVALITGWGTQIDDSETGRKGVDFVVTKPFRIDELRHVVNRAMAIKNGKK